MRHGHGAVDVADVVQIQIHQRHFESRGHQLVAIECAVFQEFFGVAVQRIEPRLRHVFLCGQKETARSAAGVRNGLARFRADTTHHGANQRAGREVLACAALDVLGVLLE